MMRRGFLAGLTVAGIEGVRGLAEPLQNSTTSEINPQQSNRDAASLPRAASPGTLRGEMLYHQLGRTGVEVSAIGIGGFHLGKPDVKEAEAIRLVHEAIDRGITFLDNS